MQTVFADGGYAGPALKGKLDKLETPNIDVVPRNTEKEFVPVSKLPV